MTQSGRSHIGLSIYSTVTSKNLLSQFLITAALFGCGPRDSYVCDEQHSAVANARALTEEQLSYVHDRVLELKREHPNARGFSGDGANGIPDDLSFLEARQISIYRTAGPRIKLADCLDEHVGMNFVSIESGRTQLVLWWHTGPNSTESEVLWSREIDGRLTD
jgi:hypothetical protein